MDSFGFDLDFLNEINITSPNTNLSLRTDSETNYEVKLFNSEQHGQSDAKNISSSSSQYNEMIKDIERLNYENEKLTKQSISLNESAEAVRNLYQNERKTVEDLKNKNNKLRKEFNLHKNKCQELSTTIENNNHINEQSNAKWRAKCENMDSIIKLLIKYSFSTTQQMIDSEILDTNKKKEILKIKNTLVQNNYDAPDLKNLNSIKAKSKRNALEKIEKNMNEMEVCANKKRTGLIKDVFANEDRNLPIKIIDKSANFISVKSIVDKSTQTVSSSVTRGMNTDIKSKRDIGVNFPDNTFLNKNIPKKNIKKVNKSTCTSLRNITKEIICNNEISNDIKNFNKKENYAVHKVEKEDAILNLWKYLGEQIMNKIKEHDNSLLEILGNKVDNLFRILKNERSNEQDNLKFLFSEIESNAISPTSDYSEAQLSSHSTEDYTIIKPETNIQDVKLSNEKQFKSNTLTKLEISSSMEPKRISKEYSIFQDCFDVNKNNGASNMFANILDLNDTDDNLSSLNSINQNCETSSYFNFNKSEFDFESNSKNVHETLSNAQNISIEKLFCDLSDSSDEEDSSERQISNQPLFINNKIIQEENKKNAENDHIIDKTSKDIKCPKCFSCKELIDCWQCINSNKTLEKDKNQILDNDQLNTNNLEKKKKVIEEKVVMEEVLINGKSDNCSSTVFAPKEMEIYKKQDIKKQDNLIELNSLTSNETISSNKEDEINKSTQFSDSESSESSMDSEDSSSCSSYSSDSDDSLCSSDQIFSDSLKSNSNIIENNSLNKDEVEETSEKCSTEINPVKIQSLLSDLFGENINENSENSPISFPSADPSNNIETNTRKKEFSSSSAENLKDDLYLSSSDESFSESDECASSLIVNDKVEKSCDLDTKCKISEQSSILDNKNNFNSTNLCKNEETKNIIEENLTNQFSEPNFELELPNELKRIDQNEVNDLSKTLDSPEELEMCSYENKRMDETKIVESLKEPNSILSKNLAILQKEKTNPSTISNVKNNSKSTFRKTISPLERLRRKVSSKNIFINKNSKNKNTNQNKTIEIIKNEVIQDIINQPSTEEESDTVAENAVDEIMKLFPQVKSKKNVKNPKLANLPTKSDVKTLNPLNKCLVNQNNANNNQSMSTESSLYITKENSKRVAIKRKISEDQNEFTMKLRKKSLSGTIANEISGTFNIIEKMNVDQEEQKNNFFKCNDKNEDLLKLSVKHNPIEIKNYNILMSSPSKISSSANSNITKSIENFNFRVLEDNSFSSQEDKSNQSLLSTKNPTKNTEIHVINKNSIEISKNLENLLSMDNKILRDCNENVEITNFDNYSPASPIWKYDEETKHNPVIIPLNRENNNKNKNNESLINAFLKRFDSKKQATFFDKVKNNKNKVQKELSTKLKNILDHYINGPANTEQVKKCIFRLLKNTQNSKVICKAIIDIIEISKDKNLFTSNDLSLQLSETEAKIIVLIDKFNSHIKEFKQNVITEIHCRIFRLTNESISLNVLKNLIKFNITLMDLQNSNSNSIQQNDDRKMARLLVCKCFYYYHYRATPIVFQLLVSYPSLLPRKNDPFYKEDDPIIKTIQCILNCTPYCLSKIELRHHEMFYLLKDFYNYERVKPSKEELIEFLINRIRENSLNDITYSFALICKHQGIEWTEQFVIEKNLLSIINEYYLKVSETDENDKRIECLLESLSFILKPFPLDYKNLEKYLQYFINFLHSTTRKTIQQASVCAILRTSRFGFVNAFTAISNWQPNFEVDKEVRLMIQSFLYKKPLFYWKKIQNQIAE